MLKNINREPLVSIIVITCNSAKYVLETLESIKTQTYKNIELIVSDDCSRDNTLEICGKWLKDNTMRFTRTDLITVSQNTGIPSNCNRGLRAAKGLWIKYIAGDDMLIPDCILEFIKLTNIFPDENFFVSGMYILRDQSISEIIYPPKNIIVKTSRSQFRYMAIFMSYIPSPAVIFKAETLKMLNGFDERYKLLEDLPLFLKLTATGYRFNLIQIPLVIYRSHSESITKLNSTFFQESLKSFLNESFYPLLKNENMLVLLRHYRLLDRLINSSNNKEKLVFSLLMRLSDPYTWYLKYQKIFFNKQRWCAAKSLRIRPIKKEDILKAG